MKIKQVTTKEQLEKVFHIRTTVFVEEQGVALEDEFDEHEETAKHILLYYNNEPAASGRFRIVDGFAKIERICVLKEFRKYGLGKEIVTSLEQAAKKEGLTQAKLHGQVQAESFYRKLGYKTSSDVFMEDGIPHVIMKKEFLC
ncbi:GNAT family N-acetyltransferase [Priestia megaterium]|uniref:GNAT family N-acetyltransferase n=1 Tax=Priestia megaterium TaxID=1404 RepID=UPI0026E215CB|nr:GNAT family N-acetyltransferase [Priestia megaterium]MDO6848980.1 GNAT family N-acetyltransferase [Priestia megaterium]